MKKLLGTSALIAAGLLVASPAQAADPLKLDIGGYYRAAVGAILDQEDGVATGNLVEQPQTIGTKDQAIKQDVEIHFSGETTLDNGLTVGVQVELEGNNEVENNDANTGTETIDEAWMYFKGSFGEIRVGDEDDARRLTGVTAPVASGLFGVNDPWFSFVNNPGADTISDNGNPGAGVVQGFDGENDTLRELEQDSTKLIYFTPSFNGFTLAASYAPDDNNSGGLVDGGAGGEGSTDTSNSTAVAGALSPVTDAYSLGLRYDGDMSGVRVKFGAGYSQAASAVTVANRGEPTAAAFGLNLGFDNITVGASYGSQSDYQGIGNDVTTWDAGVTYETGPYQVGLAYSTGEYEQGTTADFASSEPKLDVWALTGSYALGPGVALTGALTYNEFDKDGRAIGTTTVAPGNAIAKDYDATSVMLGTVVRF